MYTELERKEGTRVIRCTNCREISRISTLFTVHNCPRCKIQDKVKLERFIRFTNFSAINFIPVINLDANTEYTSMTLERGELRVIE